MIEKSNLQTAAHKKRKIYLNKLKKQWNKRFPQVHYISPNQKVVFSTNSGDAEQNKLRLPS